MFVTRNMTCCSEYLPPPLPGVISLNAWVDIRHRVSTGYCFWETLRDFWLEYYPRAITRQEKEFPKLFSFYILSVRISIYQTHLPTFLLIVINNVPCFCNKNYEYWRH